MGRTSSGLRRHEGLADRPLSGDTGVMASFRRMAAGGVVAATLALPSACTSDSESKAQDEAVVASTQTMPDLVGMRASVARQYWTYAGHKGRLMVEREASETEGVLRVISQEPAPGSELVGVLPASIVVSTGPIGSD